MGQSRRSSGRIERWNSHSPRASSILLRGYILASLIILSRSDLVLAHHAAQKANAACIAGNRYRRRVCLAEINTVRTGLAALALLSATACSTHDGDGSSPPQVIADGRTVYVLNAATEQEARASAVGICRIHGGNAVLNGMVQYRRHHTLFPAAEFDCTN
jgi:hypothetical protein